MGGCGWWIGRGDRCDRDCIENKAFEAKLDPDGSVVVAGGFFTSAGGAFGPAVAAILFTPGDYSAVLLVAIGFYFVVALMMIAAARLAHLK